MTTAPLCRTPPPASTSSEPVPAGHRSEALLEAIFGELHAIRLLLERPDPATPPQEEDDPRHVRLLEELDEAMEGFDLEFDVAEVFDRRQSHHGLDEALTACRITDTDSLGRLFRSLRDRKLAGRQLKRDGRCWRLRRT